MTTAEAIEALKGCGLTQQQLEQVTRIMYQTIGTALRQLSDSETSVAVALRVHSMEITRQILETNHLGTLAHHGEQNVPQTASQ